MALPTRTQILTGEYSADGSPYVQVTSKSTINPSQFEYSSDGRPWWGFTDAAGGEISVAQKTWSTIKKIAGVVIAAIKKIGGVEP